MTITGAVNARLEAVVRLRLRGPTGTEAEVDAVVDTGYTGTLTLPTSVIASLGLAQLSGGRARLADGSLRRFNTYGVDLEWGGTWRTLAASALGNEALVGMGMLTGNNLNIDVISGGALAVVPLPQADAG